MFRNRTFLEAMRDAIFVADADTGMIVDANPAAEVMSGRSLAELQSLHHTRLHPPEVEESARLGFQTDTQVPGLTAGTVLHKDGHRIPVEIGSSHFTAPDGRQMLIGVFRDTTERDQAREALRRNEERFRQVAECAGDFIWEVDQKGLYLYASPMVEEILGYSPEEIVGEMHFYDLFVPENREELKTAAFDAFARREPFRAFLNSNLRKDGEAVILETHGLPMYDAHGNFLGYRGTDRDITERRRAQGALRESESKIREILDSITDAFFSLDDGMVVRYFNPAAERMLNRKAVDVLGRRLLDAFPEARGSVFEKNYAHCIRTKTALSFEAEFNVAPYENWYDVRIYPDKNGISVFFQVITERKRVEQALRESEECLKAAERLTHVGYWRRDLKANLVTWSEEVFRIFGQPQNYAPSFEGFLEAVVPQDRERVVNRVRECIAAKKRHAIEYQIARPNGELRTITSILEVLSDEEGVPTRMLGGCQDITELRNEQKRAFERQKLESVGSLARGIAHDFNNLLAGVVSQAELALAEIAAGSYPKEELKQIESVALRGSEIVRELMIYAGQEAVAAEAVDVSQIIEEMLELLKVSVSKHARLEVDLGRDLPIVRANTAQLGQIALNLVINASEAIGERDGVIRVTTRPVTIRQNLSWANSEGLGEGDYLQLEVSDTGIGMSEETQSRVFEPFFTTKSGGHGFGLAVVQGIVRSLHGAIQLTSALGKGTTLRVLLPCVAVPTKAPPLPISRPEEPPQPSQVATILVVEDEDAIRKATSKMLRNAGFSVIEAMDGSAALDRLRGHKSPIDVLFLDVTLPGTPSHEILEEAKRLRPEIKVIVTSAYGKDAATASLKVKVERFLRKPYRFRDVVNLVRQTLSKA